MKYVVMAVLCLLGISALEAGSVWLINDSAYKLSVTIQGADGTRLGQLTLDSQQSKQWSDFSSNVAYYNQSMTPYTVRWSCVEGGTDFSVFDNVSTGSTLMAMSGTGNRVCQRSKKEQEKDNQPIDQPQYPNQENVGPPQGLLK